MQEELESRRLYTEGLERRSTGLPKVFHSDGSQIDFLCLTYYIIKEKTGMRTSHQRQREAI